MYLKYRSAALRNRYSTPTPNVVSRKMFKKYLQNKEDDVRKKDGYMYMKRGHSLLSYSYQMQGLESSRSEERPKRVAAKRLSEWMTTPPTICLLTSYSLPGL
jgi:hypothetical protein